MTITIELCLLWPNIKGFSVSFFNDYFIFSGVTFCFYHYQCAYVHQQHVLECQKDQQK